MRYRRSRQAGVSLLEVLGALGVGAILLFSLIGIIDASLEDSRGEQAALQQSQLVDAARKYIASNYSTLVTSTAAAVVGISVASLRSAGFLSSGFADLNSYSQNSCVLVRQPSAGRLDALVATYGGSRIPDKNIAAVAMNAGVGAGYIKGTDTGFALGPSWRADTTPYRGGNCGGGSVLTGGASDAGHLVSNLFFDGPGQLSSDFLYRDAVPGRPELNRMSTPLQMSGAGLQTAGAACSTPSAIAVDQAAGSVVVCSGGVWTGNGSSWKAPVSDYASLVATAGTDGDVRMVRDIDRAFAYDGTSGGWVPLAINQNGRLLVPGNLIVTGETSIDGILWARGAVRVLDGMSVDGGMLYVSAGAPVHVDSSVALHDGLLVENGDVRTYSGHLIVDGQIQSTGSPVSGTALRATGTAMAGQTCTTVGTIRANDSGMPLFCVKVGAGSEFRFANGELTPGG